MSSTRGRGLGSGRRKSRRGLWLALAGAAIPALGCDGIPEHVRESGRRQRLAELGVEAFDSTKSNKLAGMSAIRRIEVEPLNKRSLDGDTLSAEYHAFLARCGACHDVPDPASKEPHEWRFRLTRMSHYQEKAGLLPMSPEQEAAVLDYLQRHAR